MRREGFEGGGGGGARRLLDCSSRTTAMASKRQVGRGPPVPAQEQKIGEFPDDAIPRRVPPSCLGDSFAGWFGDSTAMVGG